MKMSELIKKLQEIDNNTPFDAEVIMGDESSICPLISVLHDPPYTILDFDFSQLEEI